MHMTRRAALAIGASGPLALCVPAIGRAAAEQSHAFAAAVESVRRSASIPALAVGVIDQGDIVYVGGFGHQERTISGDSLFRAASISKLFTAQLVLRLAEAGKLDLDADVGQWLPAFAGRQLTPRHILIHRSGLEDRIWPVESVDSARPDTYLVELASQRQTSRPGEAYRYTDADYNLLGCIVAQISRMPFAAFARETLLAPLALRQTTLFPPPGDRDGVVPGVSARPLGPLGRHPFDIAFAPSEGLVTTAHELATWTCATLLRDPRILRPATFDAMIKPQSEAGRPDRWMGLGWQLRKAGGRLIAEHGGSIRGYEALVLTYPNERRGFVILGAGENIPRWDLAAVLEAILPAGSPSQKN